MWRSRDVSKHGPTYNDSADTNDKKVILVSFTCGSAIKLFIYAVFILLVNILLNQWVVRSYPIGQILFSVMRINRK